jgi:hypothetical protein
VLCRRQRQGLDADGFKYERRYEIFEHWARDQTRARIVTDKARKHFYWIVGESKTKRAAAGGKKRSVN